ncbi:MAG: sulfite dehydrogenase [Gemmatimonadetes bacterium]|nr:sulfite dehydrogenase [Gemmatimonadota bacterium]
MTDERLRDPSSDETNGAAGSAETGAADETKKPITRRALIAGAAGALGAGAARQLIVPESADAQSSGVESQASARALGPAPSPVGARAPAEQPRRISNRPGPAGSSLTPLQDLDGIITPADLHFERHHGGVPQIDPAAWTLLIHGQVERPTVFTLDNLKRFPRISRLHFLECSGNGASAFRGMRPDRTPQMIDGLTSTSEWIGVSLATLFREVGVLPEASWFLAESHDAVLYSRSIPVGKAMDDALIAWGQNGEALRPEQGYPARLFLPGWEGSTNVKWLRRIELSDRPFMTRDETSKYTDPARGGVARQFSFLMDVKSVITSPVYPAVLPGAGWYEIAGIAWSGRGRIDRVEVSTDGGRTWAESRLEAPIMPKCHTRFRHGWRWNGSEVLLMSRATDESGAVQPTLAELRDARGAGTTYHLHHIRGWKVEPGGRVVFGLEADE